MITRLVLLPGTLCDQRLFAAVARRLRPSVVVRVARWRELLRPREPAWWRGDQPFSLVAFSLGGIWALQRLRGAGHAPAGLAMERLALLGSNAEAAGEAHIKRARAQQRLLSRQGTAAVVRSAKGRYFARRPPSWRVRLVLDMARRTPITTARKQIQLAGHRADGLHAFASFPGPVAVMSGADDRLCPSDLQRRLCHVRRDAWAQVWARCGHMIPLEAPGRLAQALRRWLAQDAAPRSLTSGVFPS